jgi:hypothetical protein
MKKTYTIKLAPVLIFLFFTINTNGQTQLKKSFDSLFIKLENETDCKNQLKVSPQAFNKITNSFLTKVAPNVVSGIKQSTAASLNISSDKTTAELQATAQMNSLLFNIGFNGTINNNISEIYAGKNGIGNDWGLKASVSVKLSSKLFYKSIDECYEFQLKKIDYLAQLYKMQSAFLDTNRHVLQNQISSNFNQLASLNASNPLSQSSISVNNLKTNLQQIINTLNSRVALLGTDTDIHDIIETMAELIRDSSVAFETRTAKWQGYNISLLNLGIYYNNKSFTQFNPNIPEYKNRFLDTSYNNFGINIGLSRFHMGQKIQWNANFDLIYKNSSNFELSKNKKYLKTFTQDSIVQNANSSPFVQQYSTVTKKAFDSNYVSFNTFNSFDINAQISSFFFKEKSIGLNIAALYSITPELSAKNRLDLAIGPLFSLPNSEKDASRLNFSLLFGYRDMLNSSLTSKEKFFISFNVSVPFKIISL